MEKVTVTIELILSDIADVTSGEVAERITDSVHDFISDRDYICLNKIRYKPEDINTREYYRKRENG